MRYRAGCGRAGTIGIPLRAGGPRQRDILGGNKADPWRIRYLEYLEFRLVREALMEREVLWRMAPHIIWPLRFVLPYHKGLRPAWLLRLGLFLYDHLGGRELLPATSTLDLRMMWPAGRLNPAIYSLGFEYSDCWVDDSRLVILNARDAADRGATIRTRTKAVAADRSPDIWRLTTIDRRPGGKPKRFAQRFSSMPPGLGLATFSPSLGGRMRRQASGWCSGSHIVIPKLYSHSRCYIFQNIDKRIIFAIPYEGDFTLIGTTEDDYVGDPSEVTTTAEDIDYLCQAANRVFQQDNCPRQRLFGRIRACGRFTTMARARRRPRRAITCWTWTRPARQCSRYSAAKSRPTGVSPNTRSTSSNGICQIQCAPAATGPAKCPCRAAIFRSRASRPSSRRSVESYPWLAADQSRRLARAYGTKARAVLDGATSLSSLGQRLRLRSDRG